MYINKMCLVEKGLFGLYEFCGLCIVIYVLKVDEGVLFGREYLFKLCEVLGFILV